METDVTGSTQDLQVGGYVLSRQTRMIKVRPCLKGEGGTVVGAWGGGGKNFLLSVILFSYNKEKTIRKVIYGCSYISMDVDGSDVFTACSRAHIRMVVKHMWTGYKDGRKFCHCLLTVPCSALLK